MFKTMGGNVPGGIFYVYIFRGDFIDGDFPGGVFLMPFVAQNFNTCS